jgi:hypothetical protein
MSANSFLYTSWAIEQKALLLHSSTLLLVNHFGEKLIAFPPSEQLVKHIVRRAVVSPCMKYADWHQI